MPGGWNCPMYQGHIDLSEWFHVLLENLTWQRCLVVSGDVPNACPHPSYPAVHHGGVRSPLGSVGVQPPRAPCQEHHAHGAAEGQLRAAQPGRVPAQEEPPPADHLLPAFGHQRRPPPRAHPEPVRQRQGEGQGTQPKKHEHRHGVLGPERSIPAGVWPLGAEVARLEPVTVSCSHRRRKQKEKRDEASVTGWKGKYGATLITSWYSGKRWDGSHAERAGLTAGASGLCSMSPRNSWKLGGGKVSRSRSHSLLPPSLIQV